MTPIRLALFFIYITKAITQTTTQPLSSEITQDTTLPEFTSAGSESPESTTTVFDEQDARRTCGYIRGHPSSTLTCPSHCGILSVIGNDDAYIGCCNGGTCQIRTACIETGQALDMYTRECVDGSLSRCATLTWPNISAKRYYCATARATQTVYTTTTTDYTSTKVSNPTASAGGDIGYEGDLNSKQRMGAGIGSGVAGGLLLIFFALFGCLLHPRKKERRPEKKQVVVESKQQRADGVDSTEQAS